MTLIAGRSDGLVSPVRTYSDMVYADIALEDAARYQVKAEHIERAVYVVSGALEVIGQAGRFEAGELVVFKPGAELVLRAAGATRAYPATANSSPCLRTRRPQAPLRREERGSTMAQGTARIGRDHYCTQIDLASGQTLVSDEPSVLGGEAAGATPYELVIAGLGACTAITLRMYADLRSWPLESVQVDLHLSRVDNAMVIERSLRLLGVDDVQKARLVDIAERTPVTLTLKAGISIRTHLL